MARTVLIVDDSGLNRELLRNILQDEYQIMEAENGSVALSLLREELGEIAVVLLDLNMPVMTGYQLLELMRGDAALSQIPVIVTTGSEGPQAELKALSLGAVEFILKPYEPEAIRQRVRNILRLAQLTTDLDALRVSEERYRIAASAGGRVTARYDIQKDIYYRGDKTLTSLELSDAISGAPQAFVDNKVIAPESVDIFYTFFEKIKSGAKTSTATISIRTGEDSYRWFRCDATIIFDAHNRPAQAIIVYTDVTEQREKEAVYLKWQQSLKQKSPAEYTLFHCNLSQESSYESMDGLLLREQVKGSDLPFDLQTEMYAGTYVYPDDREMYLSIVNSDMLLANYYRNHRVQTLEYRELLPDKQLRWLRLIIELVEYPNSQDIAAYMMYENIDREKREAIRIKELAEHDALTGLLNRSAFAKEVDRIIKTGRTDQHAFLMIDLDRFKQLNDNLGHAAGDQALIEIANALRSGLRHGDLLGRLGGDEFIIFMKDVPYNAVVEKKARQICSVIRKSYDENIQLSASVGIAVSPGDGDCFEALYHSADVALYSAKNAGKDMFSFFDTAMQSGSVVEQRQMKEAPIILGGKPLRRMLIVDDSRINREMLTEMFKDLYSIETASDGRAALTMLRHFGTSIAVVLLDLVMPGMDGFEVLEEMRRHIETQPIPVVVVSAQEDLETSLRAIKAGASDFVTKPVNPDLIRIRVESAVSKAESERLRAQNSYFLLQNSEEAKYRTVLESTGTVVIEYDWMNGVYSYDPSASTHIAGRFDGRRLWQILLSDVVAETADVKAMQELVHDVANDRTRMDGEMTVRLKTPGNKREWFRMRVFKRMDEYQLTNKLIICFNNVNDEVLSTQKLHFQAERDELTGLLNRKSFFEKAAKLIRGKAPGSYVMACFDIDSFKVINDQYGSGKGDQVLMMVADVLQSGFEPLGGLVSRITADNFAVLYPVRYMNSPELERILSDVSRLDGSIPPISYSIGRYIVDDLTLPASGMYDRATLAQNSIKGRYDRHTAIYDELMRNELLNRQQLMSEMKNALETGQFEPWFQPQYNHATGAMIGSEALVRWRHPSRGLVPPDEFIPAFERSGFVYELDKYMWESVCRCLRRWLDQGRNPLPVSVNISRYDILREDLIPVITGLVRRYALPVGLLRLEVTESAFARNAERIIAVVKGLIAAGFTVEIDDFGSGYSSLNTLKDVPAQVLKMDMRFLETDSCSIDGSCQESSSRGGNILESVVRMAKWLGMSVIAEGVETLEQADYLKSIGCSYIQGYLYARPMPADEYAKHAAALGKEEKLMAMETVENYDNNRFWDPNSMDSLIFNTYVGGACIFEWSDGHLELLRANDRYVRSIGGGDRLVEDILKLDWLAHMDEKSMAATLAAIEKTIATGDDALFESVHHNLFGDGRDIYLRSNFRVIARSTTRYLIYCTNENLTAEREAETERLAVQQRIAALNKNLQNMMDDMPGGFARLRVLPGDRLATVYVNDNFCRLRGMSREDILKSDRENAMDTIHPDDVKRVSQVLREILASGETRRMRYRLRHAGGEYIPVTVFGRASETEDGQPMINAYYADMSEEEKRQLAIADLLPVVLSTIMSSTSDLSFVKDRDFRYLSCSKTFALMTGKRSQAEVVGKTDYELFDKATADAFRADDLRLLEGGESLIDYLEAIPSADGIQHYSSTSKYILRDGSGEVIGLYGSGRDVTEVRTAFERLKLLTDSIPGGLVTYALYPQGLRVVYFNDGMCRLFGCTREQYAAATEENVITTVFEEDVPRLQAQIQRMVADGTPVNCIYRIRTMDSGSVKWVNLRATQAERRGGVLQANAVIYDITEQKLAEEAARVHEEEMRFAVSQLGKTLCEYDPATRVLLVPQSCADLYGLPTRLENVPDSIADSGIISEDTVSDYRALFDAILRGEKTGSAEYKEKRLSGQWYWGKLDFSSIFDADGKPIKAVITAEDTTAQHIRYELEQARPSLGEDDLMIHALFNLNTGETLEYVFRGGGEVPFNQRTAFMTGGDELEHIIIDAQERRRYRQLNDPARLLELYAQGETEFSIDYRRAMPDGEVIWARNLLRMVRQPGGSDVLLFEYCYNIEKEKTWELLYATLLKDNYDFVARIDGHSGQVEPLLSHGEDGNAADWRSGEGIHPDDREKLLDCASFAGAKKRLAHTDRFQAAFRLVRPDGELRYKKLSVYYLDRERDIIIAACEDVSQVVADEMDKNRLLSDALSSANQASSQFTSQLGRRLKGPAEDILALAEKSAKHTGDPAAMTQALGKIDSSARDILALLNGISSPSHTQDGE